MITGYFYFDVEEKNGETRQIKKIFKLVLEANVLYLLWDSFYAVLSRNMSFLLDTFTIENVLKFIAFNESPLKGHLWYLGAILYVLIIKVFYNQCALRLSCYECPYATTERKTDMTIGDFWHIEETIPDFYDEKGNSIFLIHTDRGEQLFETVKVKLEYRLSDTKQCWQANLEAPTKRSEQRDEFWNDYQRKGVDFVMKKYGTTPLKTKIKNKLVKLISIGGGKP